MALAGEIAQFRTESERVHVNMIMVKGWTDETPLPRLRGTTPRPGGDLVFWEVRGNSVGPTYARTAIQPDVAVEQSGLTKNYAREGNVHAMAPQLSAGGHYDGSAYPALSIEIAAVAPDGPLQPVS